MLYYNQKEHPEIPYRCNTDDPEEEYGLKSTIASSGCGLCSALMVGDRLIENFSATIEDMIALSNETGANHLPGTVMRIFGPAFAEKYGLTMEYTDDIEKLVHCLQTGGAAVAHCKCDPELNPEGMFTKGGHYIAVISVLEDGRFVVLDPSDLPGKFDTEYAKKNLERHGHQLYCTREALIRETKAKAPHCFYLFQRA